jgi:hypothetical protein
VEDDEFEGHKQAQKTIKVMLPPLLDCNAAQNKAPQVLLEGT